MKLSENPIFITHKRLVHRRGVLAAIVIAALVGISLLAGLADYLATPRDFNFSSRREAGETFYAWTIGIEIFVVVIGSFIGTSRAFAEDRKTGMWDSNRLTPLRPAQILIGYWLAPALREFYMAIVLAVFGLILVLLGNLPITLWLGTQCLIATTALLFGLFAIFCGIALPNLQGIFILPLGVFILPLIELGPSRMLPVFLLPAYSIINLFPNANSDVFSGDSPHFYGLPISPVFLSVSLQLVTGIFLWRALVRKTANPFQPLLTRREAIALFTFFITCQHGLIWDLWRGSFPIQVHRAGIDQDSPILALVHGGTIALGIALLGSTSPAPERLRVESLRLGFHNLSAVFSRSAVSLALVLAAVTSVLLFTQSVFSLPNSLPILLVTSGNLLEIFLGFTLLIEFCHLHYARRAPGFIALWSFALGLLPFIFAGVFSNSFWAEISLLAPGFIALGNLHEDNWPCLYYILLAHFGIVVLLFLAWRREWKKLLEKARQ